MTKKIIFTEEQINEMIDLHNKGFLNREIGDVFNISRQTVGKILTENNVPSRHPLLTSEKKELMCRLYIGGMSIKQVAETVKSGETTVKKVLTENGIKTKDMSHAKQKYTINEEYFDKIDTPNKAYILGLMYADGCVSNKTNNFSISLQERDVDILNKIKSELQSNHPLYYLKYNEKNPNLSNQYMLSITNKQLHNSLIDKGVIPNKSLKLEFPNYLDDHLIPHFIRGYLDGDGHISKNSKEKRISIISTVNFCNTLKSIIKNKLNVHCSISYCHGKKEVSTRSLGIAGGHQVKKFLDWIYNDSDLYLNRKYEIYHELYCKTA